MSKIVELVEHPGGKAICGFQGTDEQIAEAVKMLEKHFAGKE